MVLLKCLQDLQSRNVRAHAIVVINPDSVTDRTLEEIHQLVVRGNAQMALIQFMSAGLESTAVPTTVHCDHLIVSRDGEAEDLARALETHQEVYDFMKSACQRYNMGFWKPGAGIIHQIIFENYAFPSGMLVGTDSHTQMLEAWEWWRLETVARMQWASPKGVINKLASLISVKGGTGSIIEYRTRDKGAVGNWNGDNM
ncbi:Aconitate hydratase mitochondrial [Aspergillus hancockii]|nr:Aconitate hydratase mitochondrial [Aspergillus hancockii]